MITYHWTRTNAGQSGSGNFPTAVNNLSCIPVFETSSFTSSGYTDIERVIIDPSIAVSPGVRSPDLQNDWVARCYPWAFVIVQQVNDTWPTYLQLSNYYTLGMRRMKPKLVQGPDLRDKYGTVTWMLDEELDCHTSRSLSKLGADPRIRVGILFDSYDQIGTADFITDYYTFDTPISYLMGTKTTP